MSDARAWVETIGQRLARWRSRGLSGTWIVAVSGGGDSVGLLRILHELAPALQLRLSVAHLDHGVRGEAARQDAEFVSGLAASLGLPFDLGRWQPTRAGHFESDARRARYAWLIDVARTRGAGVVAVGHTRDDQAETILHRIIRGTGPRGLAGIPPRRRLAVEPPIELVRPLLDVSRASIRADLERLGQPFREDASNADVTRTRARIRHELLPRLAADYNPRVDEAIVRLGGLVAASQRAIEGVVRDVTRSSVATRGNGFFVLKPPFLRTQPLYLRTEVLRRLWRDAGWPQSGMSAQHWRRLGEAVATLESGSFDAGAGVVLTVRPPFLVLHRTAPTDPSPTAEPTAPLLLPIPGDLDVPWADGRIIGAIEPAAPADEAIDLDRLDPPLSVRAPVSGDRFAPLGMGGRSMALADFFRGRDVGRDARMKIPIVSDRQGIVWVVGHRIAERVKVTDSTERRLMLRWVADR
ncbi:MAG: tRNA lysidine(34) synthetase TilS [Isosphaeraceae bacterium]